MAVPSRASDVTDRDRVYAGFTREAATVGDGRLRLEVRGLYLEETNADLNLSGLPVDALEQQLGATVDDVRGGIFEFLGSYGLGDNAEVGFLMPFFLQETDLDGGPSVNDEDAGDLVLYGKFQRQVATHCRLAGGLELQIPTGPEDKGFGTGELAFNPFLSSRYQRGLWAVGAQVGYRIYTGQPDDEFNWGTHVLLRANDQIVFRTEVAGRYFKSFGDKFNDVRLLPGFDLQVGENVLFRPTMLIGLSDETANWGGGLGIVVLL
jgi:hypothetical protein